MIPNIGPLEIAVLVIILLIIFGPKKIPQLGRSLGRGITEFRDGVTNRNRDGDDEATELPAGESGSDSSSAAGSEKEKTEEVGSA